MDPHQFGGVRERRFIMSLESDDLITFPFLVSTELSVYDDKWTGNPSLLEPALASLL